MKLSTGKEVYAHDNIVGINEDSTFVGGGYDDKIDHKMMRDQFRRGELSDSVKEDEFLTASERIEMAQEMIHRWQVYREEAEQEKKGD